MIRGSIVIDSTAVLPETAGEFLSAIADRKVIAFYGEMGAGKTTFIKALCAALGVKDATSSPTFSIINEYRSSSGEALYHFDFYRIKDTAEAFDMGYEDYFYSGRLCLIEWPEKIEALLPPGTLKVRLEVQGERRLLSFL